MLLLPFTADPAQTFDVQLGDTLFTFNVRYNERPNEGDGVWSFDLIRTSDGVMLLSNVPILIGQDMLDPYALQIGALTASDTAGTSLDAGPDDLGDRVVVYWFGEDEKVGIASLLKAAGVPL